MRRVGIVWSTSALLVVVAIGLCSSEALGFDLGSPALPARSSGGSLLSSSATANPLTGGPVTAYSVTFEETGLPTGTQWQVGVAPSGTGFYIYTQSTGTSISQSWTNGTYEVVVAANLTDYVPLHLNSTLDVAGGSTVVPVNFALRYPLTFEATGLPRGASWTVTAIQGSNSTSGSSLTNQIELLVAPGAYNYTVYSAGLVATPSAGSGVASGSANISVGLALPSTYPGYLTGIVNVGSAYFYLNGYLFYVQLGGGFFFQLKPGAYTIIVTSDGYNPYYNTTDIASNQTVRMIISLEPTPTPPPPLPTPPPLVSNFAWLVIGILSVALVITAVVAWMNTRGRRPPPGPIKEAPPVASQPES